jgi:hypothetical protein
MPSQNSGACWNPAVPPPPVAGAALGKVREGFGCGFGLALELDSAALALGPGAAVAVAVAVGVTVAVGVAVAVPAEFDGVAGVVPGGENEVGVDDGEPDVQAETDAGASMVKVAQPMAVSLARSPVPAMVVRIL